MSARAHRTPASSLTGFRRSVRSWATVFSAAACFACERQQPPETCGTIPEQVVHVGETATALACFEDPNGDLLLYWATVADPDVATVISEAARLTITGRKPGTSMVSATATDAGGLMAETRFQVTVPNRAPITVGAISALVLSAGSSVVADVSGYFDDPDGEELTYAAVSADKSVAAVSGAGALFTVEAQAKGSVTVTVTASDPGGLSATQTFTVTVPNRAPLVVDSIPGRTVEVGETITQGLVRYFSDPDADPLSFAAASADPRRVAVAVSDSAVSVTALAKGVTTVTVTATDAEGLTATLDFAVSVPNRPPEAVGAIPGDTMPVGESRNLNAASHFSDPDGDALVFAATTSDSTVARTAVAGGIVTVGALGKGEAAVTVTATDTEGLVAAQTFAVTVPNRAPAAEETISARTVTVGDSVVLNVSPFFSDPDDDALVYSATASDTSVAKASVSGAALRIAAIAKGETTVTITAADTDGLSATQTFIVTVPNRAPLVVDSIPGRTVEVRETITQRLVRYFSDPDGDPLSFAAAATNPLRVAVAVSDGAVLVTALAKGGTTVTVTATDTEGLTAALDFAVSVPNRPPEAVGAVPGDTMPVGESRNLNAASLFSDPDGDTLDYSATTSDSTVVTTVVAGGIVTVGALAKGEAAVTLTATDTEGLVAVQAFAVIVPNRAPAAAGTIRSPTIEAGDSVVLDLSQFFSDPDGDALVYSAAASDTSVAKVSVSGAALRIAAIAKGEATVTIAAADGDGLEATQPLAVVVPNRAPLARGAIPPWVAEPGDTTRIDLTAWFSDPDGDPLVCTATASDSAVAEVGVSGSTLTIAAIGKGEAVVTVTARDGDGLASTQSFTVSVHNRPPITVDSIKQRRVEVGDSVVLMLPPFFSDPDGDPLTFGATSADPAVARTSVHGADMTLAAIARGETTVTVTAVDPSGLAATQVFSVTVPNRAPVARGALAAVRMKKSAVKRLTPGSYFADPDGDSLDFETASSDSRVARAWVWKNNVLVRAVGGGVATVTILGRDPEGLSAEQTVEVRVRKSSDESGGNRSPTVVGDIAGQTMEEGDFRDLGVDSRFSDPDGDELQFSAESFDTAVATATVSGKRVQLRAVSLGVARVGVTARDPGGLRATIEFSVTVAEASGINRAPVAVDSVAAMTLIEGDSSTLSAVLLFLDPDNDDLTFSATSSDASVVISTVSASEVALQAVAPGVARVRIAAHDPDGLTASVEFGVTVLEPGTPSPICDRNPAVRNKILALVGAGDCATVTSSQLASITVLELRTAGITSLKSGDFAGLTQLKTLHLQGNSLSTLPSAAFSELSSLTGLIMSYNQLTSLPSDAFSGLDRLEELNISHNEIESLPSGLFAGLSSLKYLFIDTNKFTVLEPGLFSGLPSLYILFLQDVEINTLPQGIFSGLGSLHWLNLSRISLTSLRADVFEDLSSVTELELSHNKLTSLPPGVFKGTTSLKNLLLGDNDIAELPEGIFEGLALLDRLWLHGNGTDPMPIEVSLVATTTGEVKAVVPTGAPFAIEVSVSVSGGSTDGVITIPAGAVESAPWDPEGASSVDIVALPDPPTTFPPHTNSLEETHPAHHGYILTKSPDLPLTLGEEDLIQDAAFSLSPYATSIPSSRNTSWIRFSSLTPSAMGRWNAFLPEISPMPPARLLITAVRAACAKSLSPLEPPELISPARPM